MLDSTHARWLYFLAKRGPQGVGIWARRRTERRREAERKKIEAGFKKHIRREKQAKMARVTKENGWAKVQRMGMDGVVKKAKALRGWMRVGRGKQLSREREMLQQKEQLREWQMVGAEVPGAFPDEDEEDDGFVVVDRDGL